MLREKERKRKRVERFSLSLIIQLQMYTWWNAKVVSS